MGKIIKTMQPKHRETLSPWLRDYVQAASTAPLPLIPHHLDKFPSKWPFPRGDLYHWIPLLNRFDSILRAFCSTYSLDAGPQMRDFGCDLLLNEGAPVEYHDEQKWTAERLTQHGYNQDGDRQLLVAILEFTRMLLEHCGNRSIYASSSHLNDLLNTTYLDVVRATLEVGLELAQRYQASVKRMTTPSRQVSTALLANHYNIELERVHSLSQPFVKTPIVKFADFPPTTPGSTSKGKEKQQSTSHRNVASMYANDLVALAAPSPSDEDRWNGWGDLKVIYYPKPSAEPNLAQAQEPRVPDRSNSNVPATPTPLRRSTTMSSHQTPRSARQGGSGGSDETPPHRTPTVTHETNASGPKTLEIPQSTIVSTPIYSLLERCPADMPAASKYEFLTRLRICKALTDTSETRQQALAVRLLAITNLAYIHPEATFIEKTLRQDNDEPRRYQLVYQLAELIHPSADGLNNVPLPLQTIALSLLEAISNFQAKTQDVLSALNVNVNHGVLLYVIRKAVASMKSDSEADMEEKTTDEHKWRNSLFTLTLHMAMATRIGNEMISAGLMEILVEILNLRSKVASRNYSMVLAFLDGLIYGDQGAFQSFINASGLDSISNLIVHTVSESQALIASGHGTKQELRSHVVDYEIPFNQQQTLKWLLKFIHHIMSNAYSYGGNTDRLLRNLVDNSELLASLRTIIENKETFGSIVWTNASTLLADFINNDPTSFPALQESSLIQSFLHALTGQAVTAEQPSDGDRNSGEDDDSHDDSDESVVLEADLRPHPPTLEMLEAPRDRPLANGILAASEVINIIPTVLNSISLNNTGIKMVVSSRALDSFLEIFESPAHVHCLESEPDLASNIGSSFDELARHHPTLKPVISNAVLDMVARVVHLAKTKSVTDGWGAKLGVPGPGGDKLTADDALLRQSQVVVQSRKGKEKASADDSDVEMTDASVPATEPKSSKPADESQTSLASQEITPYITAVSYFLSAFTANSTLKSTFIRDGGIELLLDLSESPSLPFNFGESMALRMLSHLVALLVESSQIIGLPSLLNRIQGAVDTLRPISNKDGQVPYFAPFLDPDLPLLDEFGNFKEEVLPKLASGTQMVKALLNLQTLVKMLYQSFPYSSRASTTTLPQVNIYDYYVRLIKSLGPLLRDVLTEEMSIATLVPPSWSSRKQLAQTSGKGNEPSSGAGASGEDAEEDSLPDVLSGSIAWSAGDDASSARAKKPSTEEQSTPQYRNYKTLSFLLHSLMPSTFPFFQTIGKALLPRRERDHYVKNYHLRIAEALAETILDQLKPAPFQEPVSIKNLHYWIIMLHTVHEMLIDPTRHSDRSSVQIILPVLIAFKEHGGINVLNELLQHFVKDITGGPNDGDESSKPKIAAIGLKKILDIYVLITSGKNIMESMSQIHLNPRMESKRSDAFANQLVVELRCAILREVRELWQSEVVEKTSTQLLSKAIDILKTIGAADNEGTALRRADRGTAPLIFKKRDKVLFSWGDHSDMIQKLSRTYKDEGLVQEATYRANGKFEDAEQYCRAHQKKLAGQRNRIPEEDSYRAPSDTPKQAASTTSTPARRSPSPPQLSPTDNLNPEPMAIDSENLNAIREAIVLSGASETKDAEGSGNNPSQSAPEPEPSSDPVTKDDLDEEREKLQEKLIDRSLEVIRAHPDSVFEVSELIQTVVLRQDNDEKRAEVGEVLAQALMSYAVDDEAKKSNGRSIAAYAHLLSLLLQDKAFYQSTKKTLKDNITEYMTFLQLSSAGANEELPPWIPYILLIFEILLAEDEQPVEVHWKAPNTESDAVEPPILQEKETNLSAEDRTELLGDILRLLPRIGQQESLAVSVLRILVILTRDYAVAKKIGERQNLNSLFVMAKQLCSMGSIRLKVSRISDSIMIILRHIIEDEDTIRQMMAQEIRLFFVSQQRTRQMDIHAYLRSLSQVALRSPKLFIEMTNDMVKLAKWQSASSDGPPPRAWPIALKDAPSDSPKPVKASDSSVEPGSQAAEELQNRNVKVSTEPEEKAMQDGPKSSVPEVKVPVLENPDGVVHFLLCEVVNYREVDDKMPAPQMVKETKTTTEGTMAASIESSPAPEGEPGDKDKDKDKDKKPQKSTFKPEEHPIFIYRCFLLNCLGELLQSFNRAKVEFINFKRNAPLQTNTPVKPRSSILNFLLNDLLCPNVTGITDPIVLKKKAATSGQTQAVLAALVASTAEKPQERGRISFDYDDEPNLLFVRRFVLDTIIRSYKEAAASNEAFDIRYGKMVSLAELMSLITGEKDKENSLNSRGLTEFVLTRSHVQLKRLMYEKGYLAALTSSIADVDVSYPQVKKSIKYILRILRILTKTAIQLSQNGILPEATSADQLEDDIASASSLSDLDTDREETPDLYRNSSLGLLEGRNEDEFSEDDEDDDEEMYDEGYEEEIDYGEEMMSEDGENNVSDEDEDELGEMGPIEGLPGNPGVVEVIMDDEDDEDDEDDDEMDEDDEEGSDDDDDEEVGSEDMEDVEEQIEIIDEDDHPIDGNSWEEETDEDDEDEEEIDYEAAQQDLDEAGIHGSDNDQLGRFGDFGIDDRYIEDDGEEDDEEDDEEDVEEDEYLYDQDYPHDDVVPPNLPPSLGWDTLVVEHGGGGRRPGGIRSPFPPIPFPIGGTRDALDFRHYVRSNGRSNPTASNTDDGVNPLLRRHGAGRDSSRAPVSNIQRMPFGGPLAALDGPLAFLQDMIQTIPLGSRHGGSLHFQITHQGRGEVRELDIPFGVGHHHHHHHHYIRESRSDARRDIYQEPSQAVAFVTEPSVERWQDEAKMIFGFNHHEKANRLHSMILYKLAPAAMQREKEVKEAKQRKEEEERKKREEAERKEREAREAAEKAAREKKEAEDRERAEREAAEAEAAAAAAAAAAAQAQPADSPSSEDDQSETQAMEGIEASSVADDGLGSSRAEVPRIITTIQGSEVDVTELGIDPEYLAALPEEFRAEVIAQTVSARRSEAREQADTVQRETGGGENTEVFQEFLEALPDELRMEIIQQERQERRRREREEQRRQATASGQDLGPTEMDAASILLTFPPELRHEVLIDQGEDIMDQLPPDMAAEVRAMARHQQSRMPPGTLSRAREVVRQARAEASGSTETKPQRRAIVQMLDKAGIATLLRLMFVSQQGSIRHYLFEIFKDVCENRQNRLEVISTLLQILQDGSTDMDAVERSFSQLSLKAKQPREKDQKTPSSLKRTFTNISTNNQIQTNSEISPLLVVQQCLDLLVDLSKNPHIAPLFLTEHETVASTLKRSLSRKGKGKDVPNANAKAQKYAINSLLSLLDRTLVMESSAVMQLLADLLNQVTYPLQQLERRRKEAEEEARKKKAEEETAATEKKAGDSANAEAEEQPPAEPTTEPAVAAPAREASKDSKSEEEKKIRQLTPPVIPEHNLKLVINIFVARECSSKTFQNTISTIKNLSNIPDAKKVFGDELVRQARALSENIVSDLDDLLPHILKAESGTEIQGVALAKFSPGASEQNKLLRVLTALDHLFDTKGKKADNADDEARKDDLLGSLYWNPTFGKMWEKLGSCLSAIRQRDNMLNVATILLPLIESLMVVCKNTTLDDASLSQSFVGKEMLLSSPPPENRVADLFFTFTEEHRRILNELVRSNPKLMSGTFSLLVKNPKVLEFDNKRNYFNRSVHSKSGQSVRPSFPPLQLSVRREHVFHDSFKSLYFKSGDEMKFGKLNIRFHNEEGVDAGGVTREWFQVLSRQMFDPNYALFIPVSSDRTTFHPNKLSAINDEHLMFFKFIGRIIGKALYEGRLLDCYFSRAVYKRILGKPVSVKDMESFDPNYYKSLVWILENDITDIIAETFSVEDDEFGVTKVVDLIENGRNVAVTEENKHEYVRLIVEHKLLSSVKDQMENFLKGFHDIIPAELIAIFNEQELELLISGLPDIDVDDWKGNTEYHNYSAASQQIQWFWRAVRSFDKEERAKLLQFVTGTSKVPLNGFKELEGMNGVNRFNIHRDYGNKDRLPSSHTCFNQLDLPEYESYEFLRKQILKAITAGSDYFGFA
ncbi:E3 ubiquitin protein ligase TOM1-like protein [Thozetella sp. PMI_491]|nr:E3 ubiquitin protein ligase TOM1-like protein [Thozetella sp. PMI_491]